VGYYGGVNYGFGYMGIGFAGGMWDHGFFRYNTAIMHVDGRYIHNTFEDRGMVDRYTVARGSHVAFSGGPGGIHHDPMPEERIAERDSHMDRSSFQMQHEGAARNDHSSYFKANGGHPATLAVQRPMTAPMHNGPQSMGRPEQQMRTESHPQMRPEPQQQSRPSPQQQMRPAPQQHAAPAAKPSAKPAPKPKAEKERK
jgi:hypothetical protein